MEQKTEKRSLKHVFTQKEMDELGNQLANKNQEKRRIEEEKKSVSSDYSSKLKLADEQINSLSDKVASGYEMRDIGCVIQYHEPDRGLKTITRSDTGESWQEGMTDTDHTIWNQWHLKQQEQEDNELSPLFDEEQNEFAAAEAAEQA